MKPTLNEKYEMIELIKEKITGCGGGDYPAEEIVFTKILVVLTECDYI